MRTDKLPRWTLIAPLAAIGVYLALHGSTNVLVGIALGAALLAGVMAAVYHAEVVAARVGEPFGAIILALAVTVIELGLIVSILLGDQPQPTLVRDTIHAVVVLVLHGLAGLCIVVGAIKHREVQFRTRAAKLHFDHAVPLLQSVAARVRERGVPGALLRRGNRKMPWARYSIRPSET